MLIQQTASSNETVLLFSRWSHSFQEKKTQTEAGEMLLGVHQAEKETHLSGAIPVMYCVIHASHQLAEECPRPLLTTTTP
jgi:hypothetical protein